MTVYVDQYMCNTVSGARLCHLFSFDHDPTELHALAAGLGLKVSQFQHIDAGGKSPWHNRYNIDEVQRLHALKAGAEVLGLRDFMARAAKERERSSVSH